MDDQLRVGRVSSIDYQHGMVSVTYPDRGDNTTQLLPTLSNGRYWMPAIGDLVVVAHFAGDSSTGIVLGKISNLAQYIQGGAEGVTITDLGNGAVIQQSGGVATITDVNASMTPQDIPDLNSRVDNVEGEIGDAIEAAAAAAAAAEAAQSSASAAASSAASAVSTAEAAASAAATAQGTADNAATAAATAQSTAEDAATAAAAAQSTADDAATAAATAQGAAETAQETADSKVDALTGDINMYFTTCAGQLSNTRRSVYFFIPIQGVASGSTISFSGKWYIRSSEGNILTNNTLDSIGTVTYVIHPLGIDVRISLTTQSSYTNNIPVTVQGNTGATMTIS